MSGNSEIRERLMGRQHGRCYYCNREMTFKQDPETMCTIDHVVPRAQGGVNHISNYVAACIRCNNARGTIDAALFKRYVRRFGPPLPIAQAMTRRNMVKARAYMLSNGLSEKVANDILRVRLQEALRRKVEARSSPVTPA